MDEYDLSMPITSDMSSDEQDIRKDRLDKDVAHKEKRRKRAARVKERLKRKH